MEISNLLRTNMTIVVLWVDDGRFKQPYLAQVRLIGLCGWGRLHIGCALRNAQCAQVKPATTTHTQGDVSKHGSMLHLPLRISSTAINWFRHHHPVALVWRSPVKATWVACSTGIASKINSTWSGAHWNDLTFKTRIKSGFNSNGDHFIFEFNSNNLLT